MEWDSSNIVEMVAYINEQLGLGKSMANIEKKIFNVNYRVIHKRLSRAGYKKIGDKYIKTESNTNNNSKDDEKLFKEDNEIVVQEVSPENRDEDTEFIKEFKELLGPLKEIVKRHQDGALINSNSHTGAKKLNKKINVEAKSEVVQRSFKVEKSILKEWDEFTKEHKEYKIQDLLGAALTQYMKKFK